MAQSKDNYTLIKNAFLQVKWVMKWHGNGKRCSKRYWSSVKKMSIWAPIIFPQPKLLHVPMQPNISQFDSERV